MFISCEVGLLTECLQKAASLYYGLSTNDLKKLAYEYASSLGKKMPGSWEENTMAGRDWLQGFLKQNNRISLRTPEATFLSHV